MRVLSIAERAVLLTPSERRRLYRIWTEADRAAGFEEPNQVAEWQLKRSMGFAT